VIDVDPNSTTYSSEITAIVINQSAPRGGLALSPDGSLLYTADFGHGPSFAGLYVSVIDTAPTPPY
jgi:DNA-binding beta-propeller fold protein YncE